MKSFINPLIFLLVMITSLGIFSCNKIREITAFDVIYPIPPTSFTYQPTSLKSGEELLYEGAISANLDSILEANGFSAGVVGNTQFIECSVTIIAPEEATFDWLISARAEISETPAFLPEQEIGYVINEDPFAKTVHLTLNSTNIRPYLGATFFYLRVWGTLNGPLPTEWVEMQINGELLMHLEPLN